jgi:hypothetical protein
MPRKRLSAEECVNAHVVALTLSHSNRPRPAPQRGYQKSVLSRSQDPFHVARRPPKSHSVRCHTSLDLEPADKVVILVGVVVVHCAAEQPTAGSLLLGSPTRTGKSAPGHNRSLCRAPIKMRTHIASFGNVPQPGDRCLIQMFPNRAGSRRGLSLPSIILGGPV